MFKNTIFRRMTALVLTLALAAAAALPGLAVYPMPIQTASETRYTSGDTYNTTVYVDHVEDLDTILRIAKNARITARMGAK